MAEVLLVALIIALLAAIVIPNLRRSPILRPDAAAASELAALLRHARMAAHGSGRVHHVRLVEDVDGWVATLYALDAAGVAQRVRDEGYRSEVRTTAVTAFEPAGSGAGAGHSTDKVVVYGPAGPDRAYVIELAGDDPGAYRIEVTRSSGVVRLTTTDSTAAAATMAAIANDWEARCRHALP